MEQMQTRLAELNLKSQEVGDLNLILKAKKVPTWIIDLNKSLVAIENQISATALNIASEFEGLEKLKEISDFLQKQKTQLEAMVSNIPKSLLDAATTQDLPNSSSGVKQVSNQREGDSVKQPVTDVSKKRLVDLISSADFESVPKYIGY